ncbi:hypothetical protein N658DRAFT_470685 [Parathielavia hyrcaniae]|uniref:Acetylserotonin methytransferase-like protein n=1 Tax=Parathielavia hyrcaniae TaxID=113614 RepID=A0AAN6Q3J0_9PEZI|nr:hypothetical protein N658DRAFT_470685 [Parathielavia hyrcaniae]
MSVPAAGGFSLFPNPNNAPRPPSRSQSRPRTATPLEGPASSIDATPPRSARHAPGRRNSTAREGRQRAVSNNPWQHALDANRQQTPAENAAGPYQAVPAAEDPVVETTYSQPVTDAPQRCETAFSEAQTLVRSSSQRSRSSIAKPPITYPGPSSSSQPEDSGEPAPIRSMFPRYNPEIPLARQDYYPTQTSPTHIPQSAISRPLYSPRSAAAGAGTSSGAPAATQTPNSQQAATTAPRWPPVGQRQHHEPAVIRPVNTTEELRGLWKVTNGWRASSFDGRTYCLKMMASPDVPPSYTLSSSTNQPFYCLRVDPTSSSALVTLSRYDPNKPFKASNSSSSSSLAANIISLPSPHSGSSSPSPRASSSSRQSNYAAVPQNTAHTPATTSAKHQKHWQEVLSTQLAASATLTSSAPPTYITPDGEAEAEAEAEADEDQGLLAHLWPSAAARLVADRANDATTVALAQQESARLVYDADSGNYFLVHPALAMPFCVTVDRHPAYSRTEYTLEHLESPVHVARLVRDGTGQGWLEVDTGIAGKIEAVYLVDVVVAALVIVAHLDGRGKKPVGGGMVGGIGGGGGGVGEVFEPPPVVLGGPNGSVYSGKGGSGEGGRSSWSGRRAAGSRASRREEKKKSKKAKKKQTTRMEQFEIDLESQTSDLGKGVVDKDKLPGVLRLLVGLFKVTFKCFVWCATLVVKALLAILSALTKCCGLGKL